MRRRTARVLLTSAVTLIVSGALGAAPATQTIAIEGFMFRPAVVTVNQGDVVEWQNKDIVAHTATAKGAGLDSGEIPANATFRFTATRKGRFDYICTLHPTMKGTLVVD